MQAGTQSAILCKSGNGRHVYSTRGRKTLQMHGFPIQTYGKSAITLIQRRESKIPHTYQPVQNQKRDKISEKAGFLV